MTSSRASSEPPPKRRFTEAEAVEWQLARQRRVLAERLRRTTDRAGVRRKLAATVTKTLGSAATIGLLMWMVW
jgi:hypothetical protein